MEENIYKYFEQELESLDGTGNRRKLPHAVNEGKYISVNGKRMLNISSNDYLGLACDQRLQNEFLPIINTFVRSTFYSCKLQSNEFICSLL